MKNLTVTQDTAPTAYITKGKQRIKQNGETVYLKDGKKLMALDDLFRLMPFLFKNNYGLYCSF